MRVEIRPVIKQLQRCLQHRLLLLPLITAGDSDGFHDPTEGALHLLGELREAKAVLPAFTLKSPLDFLLLGLDERESHSVHGLRSVTSTSTSTGGI